MREGNASDAHQLARYAGQRRHVILVATVLDLETRLTDTVLDMTDKLIDGLSPRRATPPGVGTPPAPAI